MKKVYLLFLILFSTTIMQAQIANTTDSLALVALYNSTDGANWKYNTNWLTGNVNTWCGIYLDANGRVTAMCLNYNQLSGSIPTEFGNLTNLTDLWLYGNQLTGSIPTEFGNLTNLTYLNLYNNRLTGSIPTELGNLTKLEYLSLSSNQLSGSIPSELDNLTNLTRLDLSINKLTGSIPTGLGNLTKLEYLSLSRNQLSGSIPSELGNLTNLTRLDLSINKLTGSIPTEIGNLTNLTSLNLSYNQLTSSIPTEIGNLTNLTRLNLYNNHLTGSIPTEIGNLTNLTSLDLSSNQLSGSIPPELGNLTNLTELDLRGNQLTGSIPPELGNLTKLTRLYLHNNQLTGSIPTEIGNLTNLTYLYLYNNQLSDLPDLHNLTNLYLYVKNNKLSFEDLEPNISLWSDSSYYNPQAKLGTDTLIVPNAGEQVDLVITVGGTANQYQWYKDGNSISGATDSVYSIASYDETVDRGIYYCKITNTIVTGLTLTTENFYVGNNYFTISASANPSAGGTVSGAGIFENGETANLTVIPAAGYDFINWTENGTEVSTDSIYSFTVTEDRTLVANFEIQSFTISASANPSTDGTISGAGTFDYGTTANLTARPATGYGFVNWTENGAEVSTGANYSFTVTEDRTLVANFSQQTAITEIGKEQSFKIYPNPTRDFINIEFNNSTIKNQSDIKLYLIDNIGRKTKLRILSFNSNEIQINIRNKKRGIYYLQLIINDEQTKTFKVILTD